jgi:hypothetical protein
MGVTSSGKHDKMLKSNSQEQKMWDWGCNLRLTNTTDAHTSTGKSTKSALSTRTRGLGTVTTGSTDLDVKSGDTDFLALGSNILSSQHSSVGRGLIAISLNLHTTYKNKSCQPQMLFNNRVKKMDIYQ